MNSNIAPKPTTSEKQPKTKSRYGCRACKLKRLKCDETKPACNQCGRRGIACPGYKVQFRWSTKYERGQDDVAGSSKEPFWPQGDFAALSHVLPRAATGDELIAQDPQDRCTPTTAATLPEAEPSSPLATDLGIDDITGGFSGPSGVSRTAQDSAGTEMDFLNPSMFGDDISFGAEPEHLYGWDTIFGDETTQNTDDLQLHDYLRAGDWYAVNEEVTSTVAPWSLTKRARSSIPSAPVDFATMLVEHWFSTVCPMWSAFDSPKNPHRQIALRTWQNSEAVFYALQSMSAACLVDSLPHIKQVVGGLTQQAVVAIQRGKEAYHASSTSTRSSPPTDLLLAIFAMGTSVCWTDTRQLGLWFLETARELLEGSERRYEDVEVDDRKELAHFREAMVYWEMLGRVVGWDAQGSVNHRRKDFKNRLDHSSGADASCQNLPQPVQMVSDRHDSAPHPWTGVSTNVQEMFGLVMSLCREHCQASKKRAEGTTTALVDALCNIEWARDLERQLTTTSFGSTLRAGMPAGLLEGTGDATTPISHFVDIGEAYRLAALLQLYQTFPDLEIRDAGLEEANGVRWHPSHAEGSNRAQSLLSLGLEVTDILKRIPAESGTRCIQPMLYVSAASALKFDTSIQSVEAAQPLTLGYDGNMDTFLSSLSDGQLTDDPSVPSGSLKAAVTTRPTMPPVSITTCTLEVSEARRFVVDRLCALQRSLPPRPIAVALNLVKTVWTEYDYSDRGGRHWIDVMVDHGLQTLFG